MNSILQALWAFIASFFRTRASMQMEILALRHQLAVCQRSVKRPKLKPADRILWSWLSRIWGGWRDALLFVRPATVVKWRRRKFREHWTGVSRSGKPGRPPISKEVQDLIRRMSTANVLWGAPRIRDELRKLGITVAKSTVETYMVRAPKPPSQTWRTFLENHVKDLVSLDFFLVPTVTFRLLFVFVVLANERRRVMHFNVTEHPTSAWTAQQLTEAFPWDEAPRYLLRDRDSTYGGEFQGRARDLGIEEVLTTARSPWQNPYVERLIGSIRRDCLDHVVVLNERHLKRVLVDYLDYYHDSRTHMSLDGDCPEPREVHSPEMGDVVELPRVGGLHHRYERCAA